MIEKMKYPEHVNKTFLRIEDLVDEKGKPRALPPFILLNKDKTYPKDWEERE